MNITVRTRGCCFMQAVPKPVNCPNLDTFALILSNTVPFGAQVEAGFRVFAIRSLNLGAL
jgi:hypothetical protein